MDNALNNGGDEPITRDRLVQDMKTLVSDAEELVKAAAGSLADKSRDELTQALDRLKASSQRIEESALEQVEAADALIRDHPYQSLGLAFGIGVVVGVLANR